MRLAMSSQQGNEDPLSHTLNEITDYNTTRYDSRNTLPREAIESWLKTLQKLRNLRNVDESCSLASQTSRCENYIF